MSGCQSSRTYAQLKEESPGPSATVIMTRSVLQEDCVICLDEKIDRTIVLPCMHEFCFACIHKWLGINPECPLCKQVALSLIHEILSDGAFKEDKVPSPPPALRPPTEFPGVVYWHRFQPIPLASHPRISLPYCTRDIVSRLFSEGTRLPAEVMRPLLYLLDFQTRFQVPQQRIRDYSPSFLRSNETSQHRLVSFLTRDLIALRMPMINSIQHCFHSQLTRNHLGSSEMLSHLTSRPCLAHYGPMLQVELEAYAGFHGAQEDYDQAIEYVSNDSVVYSPSTGVIGSHLTRCIVEALIMWTGGSNRSPHMEMTLMAALGSMANQHRLDGSNYSTMMNLLCRARQHSNQRMRGATTTTTRPTIIPPTTTNSGGRWCSSPPPTADEDWSFLNTPRVAPSPPPPFTSSPPLSPPLFSYRMLPLPPPPLPSTEPVMTTIHSPVLSPRTISSSGGSSYLSDCVIVEHTCTREAIVISSSSSSSTSSTDSDSTLGPASDHHLPPKKRRFHRHHISPSPSPSSSDCHPPQLRSFIGCVLGSPPHLSAYTTDTDNDSPFSSSDFGRRRRHYQQPNQKKRKRRRRRQDNSFCVAVGGSLHSPILISDEEEPVSPPVPVTISEGEERADSTDANPVLMNIYQPRTVDDFYRYLTDTLPPASLPSVTASETTQNQPN